MTHRTPTRIANVLDHLGKMTAIRETHLLEESLLRTLGPILGVEETVLHREDGTGNVVRSVLHSRVSSTTDGGGHQVTDSVREISNPAELPAEVQEAIEQVQILRMPCARRHNDLLLHCYPIFGKNNICGYLVFNRAQAVTMQEEAVVNGILSVFRNYHDLLDTSQRDRLTGLYNRHSLELSLDRLWTLLLTQSKAPRPAGSRRGPDANRYWMGLIDIDHFKAVNDRHGHLIGDEILILVARVFKTTFRRTDLIYRFGGEEFAVIAPAENPETALQLFERMRLKIESFSFPTVGRVTVSIGICEADPGYLPLEALSKADKALYEAKHRGRNRLLSYESLLAEGAIEEREAGSVELF
jgi:diguanylate cyclase (GGDEF)-like protein